MESLIASVGVLIILLIAFTTMLRPVAPGFTNSVNQRLGSCVGRLGQVAILILVGCVAILYIFQTCTQSLFGGLGQRPATDDSEQTDENGGSAPVIPELPPPPEIDWPPSENFPDDPGLPKPPDSPDIWRTNVLLLSYPIADYQPGSYAGRKFGVKNNSPNIPPFHVGEDVLLDPGTPIRAIADGTVLVSKVFSQGYGQVVVLLHTLKDESQIVSIYGHLSRREGYPLIAPKMFGAMNTVKRGDIIGYVGWDDEDGGPWPPHLHMGIRIFKDGNVSAIPKYRGYGQLSDLGYLADENSLPNGVYVGLEDLITNNYKNMTAQAP